MIFIYFYHPQLFLYHLLFPKFQMSLLFKFFLSLTLSALFPYEPVPLHWYWLLSASTRRSQQKSPVELQGSRIRSEGLYLFTYESQLLLDWMKEKYQK